LETGGEGRVIMPAITARKKTTANGVNRIEKEGERVFKVGPPNEQARETGVIFFGPRNLCQLGKSKRGESGEPPLPYLETGGIGPGHGGKS